MYYYIHSIYGYIVCSEPPLRNLEDYTEITEQEYIDYQMQKALRKEEE